MVFSSTSCVNRERNGSEPAIARVMTPATTTNPSQPQAAARVAGNSATTEAVWVAVAVGEGTGRGGAIGTVLVEEMDGVVEAVGGRGAGKEGGDAGGAILT